jgi:uncharacterized membrane protein
MTSFNPERDDVPKGWVPADLSDGALARLRTIVLACFIGLIVLGLAWELWLAPLRPGGSWLALKVLPLIAALPSLWKARLRSFQWWSMLVLLYLTEGLLRATSDQGLGIWLGWIETTLSTIAFAAILLYVRKAREPQPKAA